MNNELNGFTDAPSLVVVAFPPFCSCGSWEPVVVDELEVVVIKLEVVVVELEVVWRVKSSARVLLTADEDEVVPTVDASVVVASDEAAVSAVTAADVAEVGPVSPRLLLSSGR